MTTRVEKIVVRKGDPNYDACRRICRNCKCVWNFVAYFIRHILFDNYKLINAFAQQLSIATGEKNPAIDFSKISGLISLPSEADLEKIVQDKCKSAKFISASLSRRTTERCRSQFFTYFVQKKDWVAHPEKYRGKPGLPGYADSYRTAVLASNCFHLKDGLLMLSKAENCGWKPLRVKCFTGKQCTNPPAETAPVVNELRIIPGGNSFTVEVCYDVENQKLFLENQKRARRGLAPLDTPPEQIKKNGRRSKKKSAEPEQPAEPIIPLSLEAVKICAVDMGVENFATAVSIEAGFPTILIKGGEFKSTNRQWNKCYAQLQSLGKNEHIGSITDNRNWRIKDGMHKSSRLLVDWCQALGITDIVFGNNPGWKSRVHMGRRTNQKFVQIPHDTFIRQVEYKAAEVGIRVHRQEESYTSKASALDGDYIPTYGVDDDKAVFSGKRTKRGLYETADHRQINADQNGALCIGIKWAVRNIQGVRCSFVKEILHSNGGRMNRPVPVRFGDLNAPKALKIAALVNGTRSGGKGYAVPRPVPARNPRCVSAGFGSSPRGVKP